MNEEREALVGLVRKIMEAAGTEAEADAWLDELQARVPHPDVSDLIFHSERQHSAEEIVDLALAYRPIPLPADSG